MNQLTLRVYTDDAAAILAAFSEADISQSPVAHIAGVGEARVTSQQHRPGMTGDEILLTIAIGYAVNISTEIFFRWADASFFKDGQSSVEVQDRKERCYTLEQFKEALERLQRDRDDSKQ